LGDLLSTPIPTAAQIWPFHSDTRREDGPSQRAIPLGEPGKGLTQGIAARTRGGGHNVPVSPEKKKIRYEFFEREKNIGFQKKEKNVNFFGRKKVLVFRVDI